MLALGKSLVFISRNLETKYIIAKYHFNTWTSMSSQKRRFKFQVFERLLKKIGKNCKTKAIHDRNPIIWVVGLEIREPLFFQKKTSPTVDLTLQTQVTQSKTQEISKSWAWSNPIVELETKEIQVRNFYPKYCLLNLWVLTWPQFAIFLPQIWNQSKKCPKSILSTANENTTLQTFRVFVILIVIGILTFNRRHFMTIIEPSMGSKFKQKLKNAKNWCSFEPSLTHRKNFDLLIKRKN